MAGAGRVHPGRQALAEELVRLERMALQQKPGWSRAKACGDAALPTTTVGEWFKARSAPKDFVSLWALVTVLLDWTSSPPQGLNGRAQRQADERWWRALWRQANKPSASSARAKATSVGGRGGLDAEEPLIREEDTARHTSTRFTVAPREVLQVRQYDWAQCLVFLIRTGDLGTERFEELLSSEPGSSEEERRAFCGQLRDVLQDLMDAFPALAVASDATSRVAAMHAMCHLMRLAAFLDVSLEVQAVEAGQSHSGDRKFGNLFAEFSRARPSAWLPWGSVGYGGADWVRKLSSLANPVLARAIKQNLVAAAALRYEAWRGSLGDYAQELFFRAPPADPAAVLASDEGIALGALDRMLGAFREPAPYDSPLSESLAWAPSQTLAQPLVAGVGDLSGPVIPDLAAGYVNPAFRTAEHSSSSSPHLDIWWEEQPLRSDLEAFLTSYFTGLDALARPLLVHGHPGSGKSLLTRLLAARLPSADYLPVRVELRSVSATASIQAQIEQAISVQLGESTRWADVVRGAPDRLPVVFLDGFDELLQAGGEHWDYLMQVAAFQEREVMNQRPVAVLVTSRTLVADRVSIPGGCRLIRLEPFDSTRITRWLDIWNNTNREYFAVQGLRPLDAVVALQYQELACQPLLLLLLALYDSAGNGLAQTQNRQVSGVELYERLIQEFLIRQVRKGHRNDPGPVVVKTDAEAEMQRLSVVALGMFNRGTQSVDAEAVEIDGQALLDGWEEWSDRDFGRFFFVHEAQAVVSGSTRKTYEFLHATFGEYLVARSIWLVLKETAEKRDSTRLYTLLSFTLLAERAQVSRNLADLLHSAEQPPRGDLLPLIDQLLREAIDGRQLMDAEMHYEPVQLSALSRLACYTANLVTIRTLLNTVVRVSALLRTSVPDEAWRRLAGLWESQLDAASWNVMSRAVSVERTKADIDPRHPKENVRTDILLRRASTAPHQRTGVTGLRPLDVEDARSVIRRAEFGCALDSDRLLHALGLALASFPEALESEQASTGTADGRSGVRALVGVLLLEAQPTERFDESRRLTMYLDSAALLAELPEDLLAAFLPHVVHAVNRDALGLDMDELAGLVLSLATLAARLPDRHEEQALLRGALAGLRDFTSDDAGSRTKVKRAEAELDWIFRV